MGVSSSSDALEKLGYTAREAKFLLLVARHSGYFLRRQYQMFIGSRGGAEGRFLKRALAAGHVRVARYSNRTELYHLSARHIYRVTGDEDNRNRRERPALSIKAKLMALDFVLTHSELRYLTTEREKLEYFCQECNIDRSVLPSKRYGGGQATEPTFRCFVETYPIFTGQVAGGDARITSFCFIDEGLHSDSRLVGFLKRYRRLFVTLRRFRLVYIASDHVPFRRAERAFDRFAYSVTNPEERAPRGATGEYFRLRRLLETRQYRQLDKAKLDRLRDLAERFHHPDTDSHFEEWSQEVGLTERFGPIEALFEPCWLPQSYEIFGT
ncbi:MAG: hypothetical protein H6509_11270 [Bryobacterales bacterium]|nr:hypothetical protein [Bryobacterales bacterium]